MLHWLKLHFIPHLANGHRPHFLLNHNVRQLLGIVIGIELILFVLPTLNFVTLINNLNISSVLPGVLSTLTNEKREAHSLPQLVENPVLSHAARLKAEDMATKSYFAHNSPEGKTPWYWFDQVGYKYTYAGENLAVNFTDSQDVTEAWMNSPTHRANIIGGAYRELGTGVATGMYKGREAIFVAQLYASPSAISRAHSDFLALNPQVAGSDTTEKSESVRGAQAEPTLFEKVISSPRQTTSVVLFVMLSIVLVALFLAIVIRLEHQHPDLITNGVAVAAIILAIHLTNAYIARENFETSFIAFDSPNVQIVEE